MTSRLDFFEQAPGLSKQLQEMGRELKTGSLGRTLIDLINIRASQLNGCAFCVDMHVKEAKIHGERELRVHHLSIWRESALFSPKERAALEWVETVTHLPGHGVPDEAYARVREQFAEKEITELTFAIAVINSWNRLAVSFRKEPGSADAAYGLDKAGLN